MHARVAPVKGPVKPSYWGTDRIEGKAYLSKEAEIELFLWPHRIVLNSSQKGGKVLAVYKQGKMTEEAYQRACGIRAAEEKARRYFIYFIIFAPLSLETF